MPFILGIKRKMSQVFDEEGRVTPVTFIEVEPATIIQLKTVETDGYDAVQIGSGQKSVKKINKPQLGHYKDLGKFMHVREFRTNPDENTFKVGDKITVEVLKEGDVVDVAGISKGKGFQGTVKRHGFHGGPRSHGQKHSEREPGSIGAGGPQKVDKGKLMAGRMGGDRVTVKRLKVIKIDKDNNLLAVSGAVPGATGGLLEIKIS